jgi:hypothetical protein
MPNPNMFGPASMVLSQTISSFQSMLPSISEVRKASPDDPDMAGDVRLGEIAASALAIGVGAIASSLLGDPLPVLIASFVAFALIVIYEQALRRNRPMDPKPRVLKVVQENGNVSVA